MPPTTTTMLHAALGGRGRGHGGVVKKELLTAGQLICTVLHRRWGGGGREVGEKRTLRENRSRQQSLHCAAEWRQGKMCN